MRRFSLIWRWPMYSAMRFGRSVRSSCRSSSVGKLSFTRADIDSGAMLISNPRKFLQAAPQHRFDADVSTFAECRVDCFFRRGALIPEVEQRRQRVRPNSIFSGLGADFRFRSQLFFELSRRQVSDLLAKFHDQTLGSFATNSRNQGESRQVVRSDGGDYLVGAHARQ